MAKNLEISQSPPERAIPVTDGELLMRFIRHQEEGAFESLVRRHERLVLGVCKAVLRDDHDAADAFQATFLILVRRARSIQNYDSIAGWLYNVALRWPWRISRFDNNLPYSSIRSKDRVSVTEIECLGSTLAVLARLAKRTGACSARDRDPLASRRIPLLLAVEVEAQGRSTTDRERGSRADPSHVSGKSDVGRAAFSV